MTSPLKGHDSWVQERIRDYSTRVGFVRAYHFWGKIAVHVDPLHNAGGKGADTPTQSKPTYNF